MADFALSSAPLPSVTDAPARAGCDPGDGVIQPSPWSIPSALATLSATLSGMRRECGAKSLRDFLRIYLGKHCVLEFSRMHLEVIDLLEQADRVRSARIAIAAPRGHAKSTVVTLGYTLWCMLYAKVPYVMILSETSQQAMQRLSEIRSELESNPLLREDFPAACIIPPAPQRQAKWRKDDLITGSGMRISAIGMDCKPRGRKHRENRPGLIILDDVESDALVRSAEQRDQLRDLFEKAVLKAGTPEVNIVVVGTILHHDSLLANLVNDKLCPGWTGRVYRAIEEYATRQDLWEVWQDIYTGQRTFPPTPPTPITPAPTITPATRPGAARQRASGAQPAREYFLANQDAMLQGAHVLWPERESYYDLVHMRLRDGRASFDAEKQNSPTGQHDAIFLDSDLIFWDDQFASEAELLAALPPESLCYMACDPSLGKEGVRDGDDTAIVGVIKDPGTGIMYVIDADIRRRKPTDIIQAVTQHHLHRKPVRMCVETNQFQTLLYDQIIACYRQHEMSILPLRDITHTGDKVSRIQGLQAYVASGRLRFSRRHTRLIEELLQFPHARHDDGPDALEMAVKEAASHVPEPQGEFHFL